MHYLERIGMTDVIMQVPGDMVDVRFTRNRGAILKLETDEDLPDEVVTQLSRYSCKRGWFFFGIEPLQPEDIDPPPLPKGDGKTASQRLRAVLWVLAEQQGVPEDKRNEFYEARMESIISQIKTKLE